MEVILPVDCEEGPPCTQCDGDTRRIISVGRVNCANEDASWIRSVIDVVDPDGGQACQRFRKNPTRKNWKAWMAAEGIRPFERGESTRPHDVRIDPVKLYERHRARMRVEI